MDASLKRQSVMQITIAATSYAAADAGPMRLLIVKTSSLGDIVHALPALSDAQRAVPNLRCDWLAERAFAEIPAWHPAVERVVSCDMRAWRQHLPRTIFGGEWSRFRDELRLHDYDLIIDAQGLVKSAWLAGRARGPLAGPNAGSAREPLAAWFYDRRYAVPRHDVAHAIARTRSLLAQALAYPLPQSGADAGLRREQFTHPELNEPYVLLLHGTTWTGKRWPQSHWSQLADWLSQHGLRPVLPWGNESERADAATIAAAGQGLVLPRLSLSEMAGWIAYARACVGVDTGLAHLAAAFGTPQVTLYGPTLPQLTGAIGANQVWLRASDTDTIDRARSNDVAVARVQDALTEMLAAA
ncbi:MAG: lipopolysaccharide heptosyltransferase [Nevskia sp.]|nr:lipopolysaccharide heptosyltransferase [Nevskia sp.]